MQDKLTMKIVYCLIGLLATHLSFAQNKATQLDAAIKKLESDEQFKHAILSLYVVDSKTGQPIYERYAQLGLAPASCQKVVTSVSAFELLGKNFTYKTDIKIYKTADSINLFIIGAGDPTLGSWRWPKTKMDAIYENILSALKKKNIAVLACDVSIIENKFTYQPIPDGWVWQDIGNYYGAGAKAFNWHENQYDLLLSSGNAEGDITEIKGFEPSSSKISILNFITTGKKGSSDNAYIYSAPYSNSTFATGTIPPGQNKFIISGSMPNPALVFTRELKLNFNANGFTIDQGSNLNFLFQNMDIPSFETIQTIESPSFDSINYWFLKKSVNLYGEAFVKSIAYEKTRSGSTDSGVKIIKNFWKDRGIESSALNIIDGSGLSPANRVTTNALVTVMQYAKKQNWFPSFYNALPETNGIKMKDGYIGGVRSYTGYIKNKTGTEYTFSFIVNNFDGSAGSVKEKMWRVLDILK